MSTAAKRPVNHVVNMGAAIMIYSKRARRYSRHLASWHQAQHVWVQHCEFGPAARYTDFNNKYVWALRGGSLPFATWIDSTPVCPRQRAMLALRWATSSNSMDATFL